MRLCLTALLLMEAMASSVGAADIAAPLAAPASSDKGGSFDWLCHGLPQNGIWGPPPSTFPADIKKCAGTFYLGIQNNTSQANIFGLSRFAAPYAYQFGDSYFISGSFSRTIAEVGPYISTNSRPGLGNGLGRSMRRKCG